MINLPVSEAYAYDYLAILLVKILAGIPGASYEEIWLRKSLRNQVGVALHKEVIESKQFAELLEANRQVWEMVSKASRDECKASEVDRANHRRYLAKKALQERFWPTQPLVEAKAERSYA